MLENSFNFISWESNKPFWLEEISKLNWTIISVDWMLWNIRSLSNVAFLTTHLFRWSIQWVLEWDSLWYLEKIKKWDFVTLHWEARLNEKAKWWVEIWVQDIDLLATWDNDTFQFIRTMKENLDTLLDNRVVTLRNIEQKSIFKLSDWISKWFREFLSQEWFTEIHSPKIVSSWAEWWANVFKLDYFGRDAYLAQSPQFYKQFMVPVFHRVFEVAPAFRAEKHGTSRHINEYTSLDVEMWPINSFRDVMNLETKLLKYIIEFLRNNYKEELEILKVDLPDMSNWIPEITFDQAKQLVAENNKRPFRDLDDMEPEEERLLSKLVKEKTWSDFVFITHYPFKKRPFYTMPSEDKPWRTEWFDLIFRWLEITTWWQRIHNHDMQVDNMIKKWLNPDDFIDFLKLHKAWTMPHGWFGIWSERLLQKLLDRQNIRETTLFPRDIKRLTP